MTGKQFVSVLNDVVPNWKKSAPRAISTMLRSAIIANKIDKKHSKEIMLYVRWIEGQLRYAGYIWSPAQKKWLFKFGPSER